MAVIDFLYLGEANVFQEELDSFLALAEELQLKVLKETLTKKFQIIRLKNLVTLRGACR